MNYRIIGFLIALGVAAASWVLTCAAWQFDQVAGGVVHLDPRSFERFTVVTLGTAGAGENHNRRGPCTAAALGETIVLIDAGRSVAESLRAAQIPAAQPGVVVLTHLLPENTVGLDDLLEAAWRTGRREPIRLIGPAGTRTLGETVAAGLVAGVTARARALGQDERPPSFAVTEIGDGWSESVNGLAIRAAALPGGPLPALAYRIEASGRSAVVSGTGWAGEELVGLARHANLLVHDAAFVPSVEQAAEFGIQESPELLRGEARLHTGIEAVARLAQRAEVDALLLVRLRPPPVYDLQITSSIGDRFEGRVAIPDDADEVTP